ncbi:MAG: c-type cytochrome [Lacipirellulaceae bacterium]
MRLPFLIASILAGILSLNASSLAAPPRVLLEGFELEQIAKEPEIVTPVGMTFDDQGRMFVIESHTHQRPDDYEGPKGDRILMFADKDGDGSFEKPTVFAEGFQQAMNTMATGEWLYVVTRREVTRIRDTDLDGKADETKNVLTLETEAQYPHNGLSGIALFGLDEALLIGLGENFGGDYTLVGSDGSRDSGEGGVGVIYECLPDGSELGRLAAGFWNPFSICVINDLPRQIPFIFTVDNDPDASPPCRLINVVPEGDYGHRWEYGRAGLHPLQAWDGELPGTLPMMCGTGEAPTAIIPHRGYLWVTSWGDHRIERYRIQQKGMSFTATQEIVIQGDADFRPTGMAVGPDGHLYFADWVSRSYPVHGKGRIWRLKLPSVKEGEEETFGDFLAPELEVTSDDPFTRHLAHYSSNYLPAEPNDQDNSLAVVFSEYTLAEERLGFLAQYRWGYPEAKPLALLKRALGDASPDVRLYAVRWIADEKITELRDEVAKLLEGELPTERYYLAVLAAVDWLDGNGGPHDKAVADRVLVSELKNTNRPPAIHALALRLLSPNHEYLNPNTLAKLLDSPHAEVRTEAVRTLAQQEAGYRFVKLSEIASDTNSDSKLRCEAIVGLSGSAKRHEELLQKLAADSDRNVASEAARTLRLAGLTAKPASGTDAKPPADDLTAWSELLDASPGDADSGRRLFFSKVGPQCAACHQHGGRGARVGPDLTRLSTSTSREKILASILQPSQEIAPRYVPWVLSTDDGKTHLGLKMPQGGDGGAWNYSDANGKIFRLRNEEIEMREPSEISIMPAGLEKTLSVQDFRDLLEFLAPAPKPSN